MSSLFACAACGSPSIVPPSELTEDAPVHCKGCHGVLATWGELKRRTHEALLREARTPNVRPVSPDPLGILGESPAWST